MLITQLLDLMSVLNIISNMIFKLYSTLIFLILLLIFCLSCGTSTDKQNINNTDSLIVIRDYFNRDIQINSQINRIVPIYYGECEIITSLGAKNKIVGVGLLPQNSNPPYSNILDKFFPEIFKLPIVGDGSINFEKLIQLQPDIVLIDNRAEILKQTDKFKIKTFAIFPRTFNDILKSINIIGNIVHKEQNAKILTDTLTNILNTIRNKSVLLPKSEIPKVYYVWNNLLTTVNDTVHNEIFEICGSINVLKNEFPSAYSLTISLENLYKWNPDFIIIRDRSNLSVNDILNNENLKQLKAVKNNNVYKEHIGWRGYRIETFFGIIEKSKWFHEELYYDINPEIEYQKFLNLIGKFNK